MSAESKTENAVFLHEFWIQMPVKVNEDWLQLRRAAALQHPLPLQHPLHMTIFHGYVKDPKSLWQLTQPQNMQTLHYLIQTCIEGFHKDINHYYEVSEHNHLNKIICVTDATRIYNYLHSRLGGDDNILAAKFYTAADMIPFKFHVSLGKFKDKGNAKAARQEILNYQHFTVRSLDHFHNCVIKLGNLFKLKRVRNSCVGRIIGGGANIKSIRVKTGARIKIMDEDKSKFRNILIGGEEIQVMRAENEIDDVVNAPCSTANKSADVIHTTIWVDKSKIGKLMGKGGETINNIRSESKAKIKVSDITTEEGTRAIEIFGTPEQIEEAKKAIMSIVEESDYKFRL